MNEIVVTEITDDISYDSISKLIREAHTVNTEQGFVLRTSFLSGDEIRKRIGKRGKCWVAMDQDRIVGTLSVRIIQKKSWYAQGEIPDYILAAVLPEYSGKRIISSLSERAFEFAKSQGFGLIELDTAEMNQHAIDVYQHMGFKKVGYMAPKKADHYSVVMVKWFDQCPYPNWFVDSMYLAKRLWTHAKYSVGGTERISVFR